MITLGGDPEAIIMTNYHPRPARNYYNYSGVGRDGFTIKTDGCDYVLEFSTSPFIKPEEGVEYFRRAVAYLKDRDYDFLAGAYIGQHPIGGHIHFGLAKSDHVRPILDNTIGLLGKIVSPNAYVRSFRSHYGRFDEDSIRNKSHGLEYRAPPSWMISQEWCLAFLSLAYLAGNEYKKNKRLGYYLENFKGSNRSRLSNILDHLERSEYYHSDHLAPIRRCLKDGSNWNELPLGNTNYQKYASVKRWKV